MAEGQKIGKKRGVKKKRKEDYKYHHFFSWV
jgi:hypothetical protein